MEKKMMTGSHSVRWSWNRPWRWAKTLFFLSTMLASLLLVVAPPLLVVVLDLLLPLLALLSAYSSPPLSVPALSTQLKSFNFQLSLVDLPLVSAARSLLILCAYVVCDGCRGPYLGFTVLCSLLSIAYVLLRAVAMYMAASWRPSRLAAKGKYMVAVEALLLSSLALAMAHIVVAYRGSCRERRKLLVCRIDAEAIRLKGGLRLKEIANYEEISSHVLKNGIDL